MQPCYVNFFQKMKVKLWTSWIYLMRLLQKHDKLESLKLIEWMTSERARQQMSHLQNVAIQQKN